MVSDRNDERADAAWRYQHALSVDDQQRHPYYAALSAACAKSDTMISLLASVPLEQRNAMLIFAALHYQALSSQPDLAALYQEIASGAGATPEQFAAHVVTTVERDPTVVTPLLTRSTQTNEPGRSSVFQAVLREFVRRGVRELNLIDIGTSAGLNLFVDQYRVEYGTHEASSPLTLVCESLGEPAGTGALPVIRSRVGVDANPLDLRNDDDALWLRACLWPENPERLLRLEAIERHVDQWPELTLVRADALEGLERALELVDPFVPTVVMHSWAAAYFDAQLQSAFGARMRELVRHDRVSWIFLEWPRAVPGLSPPKSSVSSPRAGASQIAVALAGGELECWGWCHPHGRWMALSVPSGPKA
jgi:hypothetical protein